MLPCYHDQINGAKWSGIEGLWLIVISWALTEHMHYSHSCEYCMQTSSYLPHYGLAAALNTLQPSLADWVQN